MTTKNITEMTREEFEDLPCRDSWQEDVECDSIVILPGRAGNLHDSDYRNMDFVACRFNKPVCRLAGSSDAMHIDGIGGMGRNWLQKFGTCPTTIETAGWTIDCLPKSGLLRLFVMGKVIIAGSALSSFEVFSVQDETYDERYKDGTKRSEG